jgi:hypothetical protein
LLHEEHYEKVSKALLGYAIASLVSAANAGVVSFNAANANAAAFIAGIYGGVTETFNNGFTRITGEVGAGTGSNKQGQWVNAGKALDTRVGTFTMTAPNTAKNNNVRYDLLMIESRSTAEFGRQQAYNSQWLVSRVANHRKC